MNMTRSMLFLAALAAAGCVEAAQASPLFYLSDRPLGEAQPSDMLGFDPLQNPTGQFNIYATTDVRLSGVSLDLMETGGGIQFTSLSVVNDGRWAFLDGPQVIENSQVRSIGGVALAGLSGAGIGPGVDDAYFHPTSGHLLATVNYQVLGSGSSQLSLSVGRNLVADWDGGAPRVFSGDGTELDNFDRPEPVVPPPFIPEPVTPLPRIEPRPPVLPPIDGPMISPGAPVFYLSNKPIGEARPGDTLDFGGSGAGGKLNIYSTTDTRLSGISLDLVEQSGGLKFTGLDVKNDGRWMFLDGPQVIEDSQVSSIGGVAIPNLSGAGIGPGATGDAHFDPNSGYLLATVDYETLSDVVPELFLQIGKNTVADWDGNAPLVYTPEGLVLSNPYELPPAPILPPVLPPAQPAPREPAVPAPPGNQPPTAEVGEQPAVDPPDEPEKEVTPSRDPEKGVVRDWPDLIEHSYIYYAILEPDGNPRNWETVKLIDIDTSAILTTIDIGYLASDPGSLSKSAVFRTFAASQNQWIDYAIFNAADLDGQLATTASMALGTRWSYSQSAAMAGEAAVPEPTSWILSLVAVVGLVGTHRSR